MRKMRILMVTIFIVLVVFCCVRFFSSGYTIKYKLKSNEGFEITEIYTKNVKNERDNYYLEISKGKIEYTFQLFNEYDRRKIVTDIIEYKGEYECILPLINNRVETDILCYKGRIFYNYHTIQGKEEALDDFVNQLAVYDESLWVDNASEVVSQNGISLYSDNVVATNHIALSNLKGIFSINSKIENIPVFAKDVYSRPLCAFVDNYYIVADYSVQQQFRTFYIVDLNTGKTVTYKAPKYISFDSYIQGVVGDKIYLYDRNFEVQYEIDLAKERVKAIGNAKKGIKHYANGSWTEISVTRANGTVLFDKYITDSDFSRYDYVVRDGNEVSGFYYLLEKRDNGSYRIFRTPVQNKNAVTYLFTYKGDIDDLHFFGEYVYFKVGDQISYYSDATGIKKLIHYDELAFNENLIFSIFK